MSLFHARALVQAAPMYFPTAAVLQIRRSYPRQRDATPDMFLLLLRIRAFALTTSIHILLPPSFRNCLHATQSPVAAALQPALRPSRLASCTILHS